MDMAFINAAGDARTFPPEDPWMAGEDLNYYYLGHLMAAGLVKLSGVAPDVGYNLAVATFFAFSVVAAFGLAVAIVGARGGGPVGRRAVRAGGHDRLRARAGRARRPAAQLRLVRRLAGDRGHDQRVPRLLVHARRPARPRDGDPVLAARARLRAAGRAGGAGRRARAAPPRSSSGWPRSRSGRCTRSTRGRSRSSPGSCCSACWCARAARPPCASALRTLAWGLAALLLAVLAVLPFLLTYDAAADGLGRVTERASFGTLGARPRRALRAVRLPGGDGLRHPARVLAPPVAHRGLGGGGRALRRLAAGRRQPDAVAGLLALCWVAAHAAFIRPRPGRRALRLGADRRRAAVPADPGGRLRQGLLRRQRPLPHEHGLQARLPGLAAARDRGLGDDHLELGVARPARALGAVRVGRCRWWPASRSSPSIRWPAPTRARTASRRRRTSAGWRWLDGGGARRPARDRVAARPRAARLGRARVRRRRLLRLRPRADLDLHGAADRDGLDRPRAAVGARPRQRAAPTSTSSTRRPTWRWRARCSSATTSATSWSGRSSAPTTATPGWRSGTSSAAASSTATGRRCGSCADRAGRRARGVGARSASRPTPRARSSWAMRGCA